MTVSSLVAALRSAAAFLFLVVYVALVGPPGLLLALLFGWMSPLYHLGSLGVRGALWLTGIRFHVVGREHIQTNRSAIYCVNHTSNVEPPIMFLVLDALFPRLRIVYKAELHGVPILGRGFDLVGFVPIQRGNREQSSHAIETAARGLAEGYSFLVFPEGTRSRAGELLRFKKGGFIVAIKAQAPIVPVAISGARAAMRKGSPIIWPVTVHVRIAPPVETAGLTLADRDGLIARVRDHIQRMLGQIQVTRTED